MSCNCTSIGDLGCVNPCTAITFGNASQTGTHDILFTPFPGRVIKFTTASIDSGDPITYTDDGDFLQAGYSYQVEIINPDGTQYSTGGDDCFTFTLNELTTV